MKGSCSLQTWGVTSKPQHHRAGRCSRRRRRQQRLVQPLLCLSSRMGILPGRGPGQMLRAGTGTGAGVAICHEPCPARDDPVLPFPFLPLLQMQMPFSSSQRPASVRACHSHSLSHSLSLCSPVTRVARCTKPIINPSPAIRHGWSVWLDHHKPTKLPAPSLSRTLAPTPVRAHVTS